jgi:hypothetical protein
MRTQAHSDHLEVIVSYAELPELVPARMLNEFVYCPRLFFLEWVDRLWSPNADTEEGNYAHRRVDSGGGAAPLPDEGTLKQARSLELSSEKLGITAKLDLVEAAEGGGVVPIDTKKAGLRTAVELGSPTRSKSAHKSCCCERMATRSTTARSSTRRRSSGHTSRSLMT